MTIRRADKTATWVTFGVIYGVITVVGLFALRIIPPALLSMLHCPFHELTNLPCPTCGGLRSGTLLAHGQFGAAFGQNPLATLAVLGLLAWGVLSVILLLVRRAAWTFSLSRRDRLVLRVVACGLISVNWLYLIVCAA